MISLYEADLNFLLGLKWRTAMQKSRDEDTIHRSQYGGVPGREAQTVTLLEELRLDYSLLTRTPYSNLDNDMTACYDHILMPISSMASKSFGIH